MTIYLLTNLGLAWWACNSHWGPLQLQKEEAGPGVGEKPLHHSTRLEPGWEDTLGSMSFSVVSPVAASGGPGF